MANEFNVLALIKGQERFVFVYDDASRGSLIDTIRDLAADPHMSLSWFDANVKSARAALNKPDADYNVPWTLKHGEKVFFTLPRYTCVRSFCLNHIVHHRAQLGVYLRLNNVPVPGAYGPSADES